MLNKHPEDITLEDIKRLVDTEQQEGYQLDYKVNLSWPLKGDEKKEFLRDITSFANAFGGYLVLGVEEENLIPTGKIPGLAINDLDEFKQGIENIIRDSIEPRLFVHTIRDFMLDARQYVIVIHIPRSWNPPHHALGDQFYSRNSAGKYPLGVEQLRRVFTQGSGTHERIKHFIRERAFLIHSEEGPVVLQRNTPKSYLHIVPLSAFGEANVIPIERNLLKSFNGFRGHLDISGRHSYNFDGLIWKAVSSDNMGSYTQFFRSGIFESAENTTIKSVSRNGVKHQVIPATQLEKSVCRSVIHQLIVLRNIGIEPPILINFSIIGIKGYSIYQSSSTPLDEITVNELFLPELRLDDYDSIPKDFPSDFDHPSDEIGFLRTIAFKLQPIFDILWQSSGMEKSPNYNTSSWQPVNDITS